MEPLATLEDLGQRLGIEFDAESADGLRATAALNDASMMIRSEANMDWVDDHGDLVDNIPGIINSVTLAVAYRAYRNPDGTTQSSVGDVSVSFARAGAAGSIFLTDAERRAVRKVAGTIATSVALETTYLQATRDNHYATPTIGGDPLPMGPYPWET